MMISWRWEEQTRAFFTRQAGMIMISKSAYRYMHTHWYQVPVPLALLPGTSTGTGTWYGSFYTSVMKPVPGTWYDFHVYLLSLFYFDESTGIVLVVPIILPAFVSITTNIHRWRRRSCTSDFDVSCSYFHKSIYHQEHCF